MLPRKKGGFPRIFWIYPEYSVTNSPTHCFAEIIFTISFKVCKSWLYNKHNLGQNYFHDRVDCSFVI